MQRVAIIGGGAAGFFLAVNLKEMCPQLDVTIFEKARKVLAKVEVSGGGRCNCTNTFDSVVDLQHVYPRGHRLLKRLFMNFDQRDAYQWFEHHGVPLVVQPDDCVFPKAQDSHAVIDCFLSHARRYGVRVKTGEAVTSIEQLKEFDIVCVTTGGQPRPSGLHWLEACGHKVEAPVPSLFTFSVPEKDLQQLMGTVVENVTAFIPATSYRATGPLLVTHWGLSGPAILKLSSYAARHLSACNYQSTVCVNWPSMRDKEVADALQAIAGQNPQKQLQTLHPFNLPARLWAYLLRKALGQRADIRWGELGRKETNRLANQLCNDSYRMNGRAVFKDEFVTCGGISLASVNPSTLESRHVPNLYFAGEVLDVDGITGGFNFQAAWTTAYTVAKSIAARVNAS